MSKTPVIDIFAKDMFAVFLGGDREHAIAHADIPKYDEKKEILTLMID